MSLFSLKLIRMSLYNQKLSRHLFHIEMKKIKLINMVSIKRKAHIINGNIFPFFQLTLHTKSQQNYKTISQSGRKNIPNNTISNKATKIHLKSNLPLFLKYFFRRFTWIFKKTEQNDNIKWLTVNG